MEIQRRCKPGGDPDTNEGCRAHVDVLIDASFSVIDAKGQEKRQDMRDQNQPTFFPVVFPPVAASLESELATLATSAAILTVSSLPGRCVGLRLALRARAACVHDVRALE